MARKRMIDPDIWQDEKLSQMDFAGRLFFIGLITQANDYGKLRGNPKLLKSLIFPYEENNIKIEEYLNQLVDFEIIVLYETNKEAFIKIKNWSKYQTLVHPAKDTIPEPNQETIKTVSRDNQETIKTVSRDLQAQVKLTKLREVKLTKLREVKEKENNKSYFNREPMVVEKKEKDDNFNFFNLENHFKKISCEDYIKLLSPKIQIGVENWEGTFKRVLHDHPDTLQLELATQHLVLWAYTSKTGITNPLITFNTIYNRLQKNELTVNILDKAELYEQIGKSYDPLVEKMWQEREERLKSPEYALEVKRHNQQQKELKEAQEEAEKNRTEPVVIKPEYLKELNWMIQHQKDTQGIGEKTND